MNAVVHTATSPVAVDHSAETCPAAQTVPTAEGIPTSATVSVVIATRGRPDMLRAALRSILAQDYEGLLEVVVVFDQTEIDPLEDVRARDASRVPIHAVANQRTPGLAGGRNTGIMVAQGDLVAFCDDDDEWEPAKLARQVQAWHGSPDAVAVAAGIRVRTEGAAYVRVPPRRVSFSDFLESRVTEIHPSGFLLRRSDLLGKVGLVDEDLPASYGEDYDLLLRLARHGDVVSVQEPLVIVHWNRTSFFSDKWQGIADGLTYLLRKFPEFEQSPHGTARIASQVAFAHAALGDRSEALRWARSALRRNPRQLRAWAAVAVAVRLVPPAFLVRLVNRRGRGL